ncbi:BCCT family transporter [Salicibibacter halophilus]|uniref:BCCT family transporter n=1 Tax=Salicibibacter halophilus TaxID=2502791 RepID=A0A514LL31_9BACI|nr:BCCT family transporter [Salicibibacter halophilus]QDI92516.1 BCCT family transporter [Salicibibacter halophilus]
MCILFDAYFEFALEVIYNAFGWVLLTAVFVFIVFCVYVAFSKFGKIKLGDDSDEPEFRKITWIAMLFSAAIGIALVFFGVAEPVLYYVDPPYGEGYTESAATTAMQFVYLHWGISAWACYAVVGAALAYCKYRKKLPATLSAVFYPLIGDGIYGPVGKIIDIFVVLAVVVGISSSLGFGVLQINSGMAYEWGLPNTFSIQLIMIAVITVIYLLSAATGLKRGLKYLANTNFILALILVVFLLVFASTSNIFQIFFQGISDYTNNLLGMSFRMDPYGDGGWISSWTLFYFGWWIAWAPFVGVFVARVSKGRTLREFMMGALFIPVLVCFFWFAVLGGSALDLIHNQGHVALAEVVAADETVALFEFLSYFPFSSVMSVLAMVLIFIFFITAADSAMFVIGMMNEYGIENPSNRIKIIWGIVISGVAAILTFTGGIQGFESALVATSLPMSIIMLLMCVCLYKMLHADYHQQETSKD